jgi:hypothetical protein
MSYDPQRDGDYEYGQTGFDEELGIDTHVPMESDSHISMLGEEPESTPRPQGASNGNGVGRACRVRPMSPSMVANYPDVMSILITKYDGRQILMVRGR